MKVPFFTAFMTLLMLVTPLSASEQEKRCFEVLLEQAGDELTVGELRERCSSPEQALPVLGEPETSAVDERFRNEALTVNNPWVITPHRPNFFMPVSYTNEVNSEPFEVFDYDEGPKELEVKFQFSFKAPIIRNLFRDHAHLYFGYTNQSFWQLYQKDASSPFRDTSHEPELFLIVKNDWKIGGWKNSLLSFGFNHQSNGREVPLSRSWNRIYAQMAFEKDNWVASFKPWYRLPEERKDDPLQADGDDNPDIHKYLGYGEFRLLKKQRGKLYTLMLRGNTSTGNGAVELTYSFPIVNHVKGYVQYFNGYGETMLDYDFHSHRVSLGIALNDWL